MAMADDVLILIPARCTRRFAENRWPTSPVADDRAGSAPREAAQDWSRCGATTTRPSSRLWKRPAAAVMTRADHRRFRPHLRRSALSTRTAGRRSSSMSRATCDAGTGRPRRFAPAARRPGGRYPRRSPRDQKTARAHQPQCREGDRFADLAERLRALYFTRPPHPSGDGPLYHHVGLYVLSAGGTGTFRPSAALTVGAGAKAGAARASRPGCDRRDDR